MSNEPDTGCDSVASAPWVTTAPVELGNDWRCNACHEKPLDFTLFVAFSDNVKRELCGDCHDKWELLHDARHGIHGAEMY